MGALARHYLNRKACAGTIDTRIDAELEWSLRWWATHFRNPKPRIMPLGRFRKPVIIFTDGACGPNQTGEGPRLWAGYGGIMYDTEDFDLDSFPSEKPTMQYGYSKLLINLNCRDGTTSFL